MLAGRDTARKWPTMQKDCSAEREGQAASLSGSLDGIAVFAATIFQKEKVLISKNNEARQKSRHCDVDRGLVGVDGVGGCSGQQG